VAARCSLLAGGGCWLLAGGWWLVAGGCLLLAGMYVMVLKQDWLKQLTSKTRLAMVYLLSNNSSRFLLTSIS
jgi:hypothetical protein